MQFILHLDGDKCTRHVLVISKISVESFQLESSDKVHMMPSKQQKIM